MAEAEPDTNYTALLRERRGIYELRIPELLLVVHGTDLSKAYEELTRRKQEIVDMVKVLGTMEELPQAARSALFETVRHGPFRRFLSKLSGS